MEKFIGLKKILGFIVIICGACWVLNTIGLIIALLFNIESFNEYFNNPIYIDGEETSPISLMTWKLLFWSAIISAILIKILGGSLSKINGNGYESE